MRSNRDLVCGAAGFFVVIIAVAHVALDSLDVLATAIGFVLFGIFHLQHFLSS